RPHAADRDRPALAQIDLVQVGLEDSLLRVARLDDRRQPRLAQLAEEGALRAQKPDLDELLRDGAAALLDPAGPDISPRPAGTPPDRQRGRPRRTDGPRRPRPH